MRPLYFLLLAPAFLAAQAPAPQKIGAINIQAAMTGTKEGQKAADELSKKLEPRKKAIDGKAAEIRGLQDKLQRGGAAMSDTAKTDLTRQIDERTKAYNRDMEDAQAEINDDQRKIVDVMQAKMTSVIDKYAQANGYAVIINVSDPNTPVLYASSAVDITKDIIDLYDKTFAAGSPATTSAPAPKPAAPKPAAMPATPPATKKQ